MESMKLRSRKNFKAHWKNDESPPSKKIRKTTEKPQTGRDKDKGKIPSPKKAKKTLKVKKKAEESSSDFEELTGEVKIFETSLAKNPVSILNVSVDEKDEDQHGSQGENSLWDTVSVLTEGDETDACAHSVQISTNVRLFGFKDETIDLDDAEKAMLESVLESLPHEVGIGQLSDITLDQCSSCCSLVHCPFCSLRDDGPSTFLHLVNAHWAKRFTLAGHCVLRCQCQDDVNLHWHCPLCATTTFNRPASFLQHLTSHHSKQHLAATAVVKQTAQTSEAFQAVAVILSPEFLQRLPIESEKFCEVLEQTTGVQCSLLPGDGAQGLIQGTWAEVQATKAIIESIEQLETPTHEDLMQIMQALDANETTIVEIDLQESIEVEDLVKMERMGVEEEEEEEEVAEEEEEEEEHVEVKEEKKIKLKEKCPLCEKSYRSLWGLLPHIAFSHPSMTAEHQGAERLLPLLKSMRSIEGHQCPRCDKAFKTSREGQVHYALESCVKRMPSSKLAADFEKNEAGAFICPHCSYTNKNAKNVFNHVERRHMERNVPCPQCSTMLSSQRMLELHIKQRHLYAARMVVCDICGTEVTQPYLKKHKQLMHDPSYVKPVQPKESYISCPQCDYQAPKQCLLKKHVMRMHQERIFACLKCNAHFALEYDLQLHMKNIHMSEQLNSLVKCEQCGKQMKQRNLEHHMKNVHNPRTQHICPHCSKALCSKHSLKVHVMFAHTEPEQREYKFRCEKCGAGFVNKTIYNDHLNTHTGRRPYTCEVCGKSFRQISTFNTHCQTHKDVLYECAVCQETFSSRSTLNQHIQSHDSWECLCQERFYDMQLLAAHQLTCPQSQEVAQETVFVVEPQEEEGVVQGEGEVQDQELLLKVEEQMASGEYEEQSFLCGHCQEIFVSIDDVQEHMINMHTD